MNPFNNNYFIGYINYVSPQFSRVHFPSSTLLNKYMLAGEEFNGGLIGTFITIEGENTGFIGKIVELNLPEKERLSLSEKAFQSADFHPTAKVEILLSFDYYHCTRAERTLNTFPNIGAKVYICPSAFIQQYVMQFGVKDSGETALINLGRLTSNRQTEIKVSQQALFSRHCAIVGTTGGGKSWTVSKLIEGMIANRTKTILIDPTGEYNVRDSQKHVWSEIFGETAYYYYKDLTIEDLFFLVKPADKIQAPKLLEAIRSLKCVELGIENIPEIKNHVQDGVLVKAKMDKRAFDAFCYRHIKELDDGKLNFNLDNLEKQITNECVYDTDLGNPKIFGGRVDTDVGNCISLITRISNLRHTGIFKKMFGLEQLPDEPKKNLRQVISDFIAPIQQDEYLLRIGFEKVGFESQAREISANAIAKFLLRKAREGKFAEFPIVVILDEAHQFLNKSVVDQYFETNHLSAFDQIAKEGRKYGLFLCLATQMPRDIPVGTLSQMGTFIVHRLINSNDKESVKQACASSNADILAFLPSLGAGEAILTGVDFQMSLSVKIDEPRIPPNSGTPVFQSVTQYRHVLIDSSSETVVSN